MSFVERAPVRHVFTRVVAAPRDAVFAAIADPTGWHAWFPGVRSARYASPPPYGVGTIREADVSGTRWVEEMIAWDEHTRWAWTVVRTSVPFATAQVESFELADAGTGARVRWTLALEPRLLARLGGPFFGRTITRLLHRAMDDLDVYLSGK